MKHKKWNDAEKNFVVDHYKEFTDKVLAAKLSEMTNESISIYQVQELRVKLGLGKTRGRPKGRTEKIG